MHENLSSTKVIKPREFKTYELEDDGLLSPEETRQEFKLRVSERVRSPELKIPLLPHVALRVMELTQKQDSSANDIADVVGQDQQLAGRLLQVANSPVYAGLSKITSVRRAVMQVGVNSLRDILLSISVGSTIFKNKHFKILMEEIWRHSLAVAYISQQIGKTIGLDNEYAFLCGLMHDVGKPLLVDVAVELSKEHQEALVHEEMVREILDELHPTVGGLIARKWELPSLLHDAIAYHHDYQQAARSLQMAALVHVADLFHYHLGIGVPERDIDMTAQKPVYDLGLLPEQIDELRAQFVEEIPPFVESFAG